MKHESRRISKKEMRAIILFGDVRGYSNFYRRSSRKEFYLLDDKLDHEHGRLKCAAPWFFKTLGDGFLAIHPLNGGHNCTIAIKVLNEAWTTMNAMVHAITHHPYWERPSGYRICGSVGNVVRKERHGDVDFKGNMINTTKHIMDVIETNSIVVHDSLRMLLSETQFQRENFQFEKLRLCGRRKDDRFKSIENADLDALWDFTIKQEV